MIRVTRIAGRPTRRKNSTHRRRPFQTIVKGNAGARAELAADYVSTAGGHRGSSLGFTLRAETALRDVRLHHFRHSHASIALGQGETVPAIGRLLGHRSPDTTLRYTHVADATVADAAERVGVALES